MVDFVQKKVFFEQAYDAFLRTLCNRTRLSIIHVLMDGAKNVSELTEELGIHQTSVSHALNRLTTCGFTTVSRRGRERVYSLNEETTEPLMRLISKHVDTYCSKRCVE